MKCEFHLFLCARLKKKWQSNVLHSGLYGFLLFTSTYKGVQSIKHDNLLVNYQHFILLEIGLFCFILKEQQVIIIKQSQHYIIVIKSKHFMNFYEANIK